MGLKQIRESRELTQRQLATKSGVPRNTISRVECGLRDPGGMSLRNAVRLGDVLGVTDLWDFLS